MPATFIVARHTPRQFVVESASEISPSSKAGCFNIKPLRASGQTIEHATVLDCIITTMRQLGYSRSLNLKTVFDAAMKSPYANLMGSATYAPPTSAGVPGRIIIKGDVL